MKYSTMSKLSIDKVQHKDRLFRYLFGNPKYKQYALNLYNALNGTDYSDPDAIEFNTIEETLFIHLKNDASFLIYNQLNVLENQSSWNPNMPLRELFYVTDRFARNIRDHDRNALYKNKLYRIPLPKLFMFYNGRDHAPKEDYLYLSDAFLPTSLDPSDISVRVRIVDISPEGKDKDLLERCEPLKE
ncbi:MAG: hypothetical protein IJ225_06225 [Solobacterium sp.]|nr:hypothetical protein [Solobacterium sp.]